MQTEIEKFTEITNQLKKLEEKKIRLEEQFRSKKESLTELLKEIKAAGYDPSKLKETIQEKEAALTQQLSIFEKDVETASSLLAQIEA